MPVQLFSSDCPVTGFLLASYFPRRLGRGGAALLALCLLPAVGNAQPGGRSRCAASDFHCYFEEDNAKVRAATNLLVSPAEVLLLDPERRSLAEKLSQINGQTTPEMVADLVWRLSFTKCTRSGTNAPSYFAADRKQTNHYTYEVAWTLTEQQGAPTISQPVTLSQADRLNGVQWRGKTVFKASVERTYEFNDGGGMKRGPWSDWAEASNQPDVFDALALMVDPSTVQRKAHVLEKRNNQWTIDGVPPGQFAERYGRYKLSCSAAMAPDPFAGLDGKSSAYARDPFSDETAVKREIDAGKAVDDRVSRSASERKKAFDAAKVTVTASEFDAKLAEAVATRARQLKLDPAQYVPAMKTAGDMVRVCSSMPEADYVGALDDRGSPHFLNYKGGMYAACIGPRPMSGEPGLFIRNTGLTATWTGAGWGDVKLHIEAFLRPEAEPNPPRLMAEREGQDIILNADIKNPGKAGASKWVCPGTRLMQLGRPVGAVSAPTRITRVGASNDKTTIVQLEDRGGTFTVAKDQIVDSCRQ